MKFNSVVTNIEQDFTESEKALGRKNIDAGGIARYEIDAVEEWTGDLVLGKRTGTSYREIGVKLRDAVSGDRKVGYLVPPRTYKGMNLVCDESGNITWGVQPPQLKSGKYTWIDNQYQINVSGLQEQLTFQYTEGREISGINGSAINGAEAITYHAGEYIDITDENVINVTGLQPSGDYAYASDLSAYATHGEVTSATSGKLDTSAYHEYSAGQHLSLNDYVFNVTGVQPELDFDYTEAGKISAINGSAVYGSEGGATYTEGQFIEITDDDVINVTGTCTLSAGPNVEIYTVEGGYAISAAQGGSSYSEGQYISIDNNEISVTGLQPVSSMSGYVPISGYRAAVQSDWDEDDNTDLAYILNRPDPIDIIPGSGISITDTQSGVVISCSATGGGGTSGYYIGLDGYTTLKDYFDFTYDGHFKIGVTEKVMVPVSNR